jgi:hypothetical protein
LSNLTQRLHVLLLLWPWAALPQQDVWIGAKACGACHAATFARQSASAHARSLYRAALHPLAARFDSGGAFSRAPAFHLAVLASAGDVRFRADDGRYVTELPAEWAFGAGTQAVTFLSKVTAEMYLELALTYYADTGSFDLTPRHDSLRAGTLHEAMGQPLPARAAGVQCFGCHSTGPASVTPAGEIHITEAGVHCEACHGPGGAHRAAVLKGDRTQAKHLVRNPGALGAAALNDLCGKCHRVASNLTEADWNSPWSIRHQPPYLGRSRCFQKSGGRLSCLTCHEPHEALRRQDAAYYRARCTACHSKSDRPPARSCAAEKESDCTHCHMPAVRVSSHLSFRNHQIGIYDNGVGLKARR